jgi:two-component system chemotaxis sensor kinase CheA
MTEQQPKLNEVVEQIAVQTVLVDPEDIMGLGSLLELLEKLTNISQESGLKSTTAVGQGLKDLVEKLVLNDLPDPNKAAELLNQGVKVLQAQVRGDQPGPSTSEEEVFWKLLKPIIGEKTSEEEEPPPPPEEAFSVAQDLELYRDFISEGLEHLDTIEVNLINLEQSPGDKETINAIFRPFHTLKGVSGFLNLKDIHRFSHGVESLLDNARNDKLTINQKMVDLILEAVDLL